jgi:DMSO/TMAO reductase YedYZ heme-binding membrane subunit
MLVLGASALWFLTRGAGIVSLLLLTASMLLGLLTWSRWKRADWPRYLTAGLHKNISLLALCFVALHVVTAASDSYAPIRIVDAVLPFASSYRPLWLGLGAVALDLLLALALTSLLRRRLGQRLWRTVHWLSYGCWGIAVVHALGTGSDPQSGWFIALAAACVLAVLTAALLRLRGARSGAVRARRGVAAGALMAAAGVAVWAATGPVRSGWAARAGTPRALLAGANADAVAASASVPSLPFELAFDGRIEDDLSSADNARLEVDALVGTPTARLRVLFVGTAGDGVFAPTSIEVRYGAENDPGRFAGTGRLGGTNEIISRVSDGTRTIDLTIRLDLDLESGTATGVLEATRASI